MSPARLPALLAVLVACSRETDTETEVDTDLLADTDSTDTDSGGDTDATEPDPIVDCGTEIPAVSEDRVCAVVGEGSGGTWLRGDVLLEARALLGGSVVVDSEGIIICAACDCSDEMGEDSFTQVDCPTGVISPGLINAHDHMGYTEGAPINLGSTRYDHRHEWRGSLSTPQNSDGTAGKQWGELRHVIAGTTSMVGSGVTEGMVRNLDRVSGLEGLPAQPVANETFPLGDSNKSFRSNCGWNYVMTEAEIAGEDSFVGHVSEGIDSYANEEFRCLSRSSGGGQDATESNTAHVHGVGLQVTDYYAMARDGASLVWSPRSNIALYGNTAAVQEMSRLGGNVALGTDWTYSGSIHLGRELACADRLNQDAFDRAFSDRELWQMATRNAAQATGNLGRLGTIEQGKVADIAVYDGSSSPLHRAILEMAPAGAALVLRGGEVLYGEAAVVTALDAGCEVLDVCGESRAICTEREFGETWSSIRSTIPAAYDAFFCGAIPDDEPTCVPSRPGEYTGQLSGDDFDGDGILDASDNCPAVFNPIRPIDGGVQPDADSDGLGDACDATPMSTDLDDDGVANDDDNCPFDPNSDRADRDTDGKGDACDACPDNANEDRGCVDIGVSVTIDDVRNGVVASGNTATVSGVVTGVGSAGFSLQDPDDADGRFSGVYVYTSSRPTVRVGDAIEVTGKVGDYYGESQLSRATIVERGAGTITPRALTVVEATDEAWEGVLARLTDGTVTDADYDCSTDVSSCSDGGLWEVGGASGVVVYDRFYEGSDWAAQIGELPLIGVLSIRFDRRRILPRTDVDFGF